MRKPSFFKNLELDFATHAKSSYSSYLSSQNLRLEASKFEG